MSLTGIPIVLNCDIGEGSADFLILSLPIIQQGCSFTLNLEVKAAAVEWGQPFGYISIPITTPSGVTFTVKNGNKNEPKQTFAISGGPEQWIVNIGTADDLITFPTSAIEGLNLEWIFTFTSPTPDVPITIGQPVGYIVNQDAAELICVTYPLNSAITVCPSVPELGAPTAQDGNNTVLIIIIVTIAVIMLLVLLLLIYLSIPNIGVM